MTSIGLRPALLFFSLVGVNTAASISARKLSKGTTRAIISSGSPFAEIAASRLSASKNPNCPIVPTSTHLAVTRQTRTNSRTTLFFEVPRRVLLKPFPDRLLYGSAPSIRCLLFVGLDADDRPTADANNFSEFRLVQSERGRARRGSSEALGSLGRQLCRSCRPRRTSKYLQ